MCIWAHENNILQICENSFKFEISIIGNNLEISVFLLDILMKNAQKRGDLTRLYFSILL